jgi:hypothetical protein
MSDDELRAVKAKACSGAGAGDGQFTAHTTATVMEMIRLCRTGTATPRQVEHKNEIALRCGAIIIERCSPQPEAAIRGSEARRYLLISDMDKSGRRARRRASLARIVNGSSAGRYRLQASLKRGRSGKTRPPVWATR